MSNQNNQNNYSNVNPFLRFLAGTAGRIVITAFFIVVVFLAIYWLLELSQKMDTNALFLIVVIPCAVCGWRALNMITRDFFHIFHGLTSLIIYYVFKGFISMIVGVFVTPFYLGKKISNAVCKAIDEAVL